MTMPNVADLLPHAPPMVLIDAITSHTGTGAQCEVTIRAGMPFEHDGTVASVVAIEFMAQSVAAFAGSQPHLRGEPPEIGYLIGCRKISFGRPSVAVGERLVVSVERVFGDVMLGKFTCTVRAADGTAVAEAELTVAQPRSASPQLA